MDLELTCERASDVEDGQIVTHEPGGARAPRAQRPKSGSDVCWFPQCKHNHDLSRYPTERSADVQLQLRLAPHYLGPDIKYPDKRNKLCPDHLPVLSPFRVLGASVAVPFGR